MIQGQMHRLIQEIKGICISIIFVFRQIFRQIIVLILRYYKNILLLIMPTFSNIKTLFYDDATRVDWYLFIEHTRRIDYAVMYYTNCLNFLIFAFCVAFPKGIIKEVRIFILILCILDLLHMVAFSGIGYGTIKIAFAICLTILLTSASNKKWLHLKYYLKRVNGS